MNRLSKAVIGTTIALIGTAAGPASEPGPSPYQSHWDTNYAAAPPLGLSGPSGMRSPIINGGVVPPSAGSPYRSYWDNSLGSPDQIVPPMASRSAGVPPTDADLGRVRGTDAESIPPLPPEASAQAPGAVTGAPNVYASGQGGPSTYFTGGPYFPASPQSEMDGSESDYLCPNCGCPGCLGCGYFVDLCDRLAIAWENARCGPRPELEAQPQVPGAAAGPYAAPVPGATTAPPAMAAAPSAPSTPGAYPSAPAPSMAAAAPSTPTAPSMAGASAAYSAAAAPTAAGGGFSGFGYAGGGAPPPVIGDQMALSMISKRAEVPGQPGQPQPRAITQFGAQIRGFKVAENQSPRPMDRVFADFNFYDNINRSYDERVGVPVRHVRAYRQLYGFEKTFLNGSASFGMRQTVNSLGVDSTATNNPGGLFTAGGGTNIFGKYVLLASRSYSKLLTAGLDLWFPTGPKTLGGYPNIVGFRDTQIQPFLGYLWSQNRFYLQGFSSVLAATDKNDVTFIFNDIAVGYFCYRAKQRGDFLTAIVPTFETHVNTPLNHRGFRASDGASQPDVVNFTFGTTFVIKERSNFTFAYVTPVTGPKPFDYEIAVLFNYRFGGPNRNQGIAQVPPVSRN